MCLIQSWLYSYIILQSNRAYPHMHTLHKHSLHSLGKLKVEICIYNTDINKWSLLDFLNDLLKRQVHKRHEHLLTLDISSTNRTHSVINSSHYHGISFRISVPKSVNILNNWQKQYIAWLPLSKTIKGCVSLYGQFLAGVKESDKALPRQTQHWHNLAKLFCLWTWISCSVRLNTPVIVADGVKKHLRK